MIYFDWKINFVDIIINLIIVILTTGITYYLFSVLPAKRRKKSLKKRLITFRNELNEHILDNEDEFKKSYELYEEETNKNEDGEEVTLVWNLINIKDWSRFLSGFRYMLLMDIYFKDYWQGKELILLINNLIMDDKKHIDLSMKLSELNAEINHMKKLVGDKANNIWKIKHKHEFIKTKEDNELISLVVSSLENIQNTSRDIVQTIDRILNDNRKLMKATY